MSHEEDGLKRVVYFASPTGRECSVDYLILDGGDGEGKRCVFTGLTGRGSSTICAAANVLGAIAERENVPLGQVRFFDLQTRQGYPTTLRAGKMSYDEVLFRVVKGKIIVEGWRQRELKDKFGREVLRRFSGHIGEGKAFRR